MSLIGAAGKLDQGPVAGALYDGPVMHRDSRIDQIASECPKPGQRTIFVGSDEPAVTDHVGPRELPRFSVSRSCSPVPPGKARWQRLYRSCGRPSIKAAMSQLGHKPAWRP